MEEYLNLQLNQISPIQLLTRHMEHQTANMINKYEVVNLHINDVPATEFKQ